MVGLTSHQPHQHMVHQGLLDELGPKGALPVGQQSGLVDASVDPVGEVLPGSAATVFDSVVSELEDESELDALED